MNSFQFIDYLWFSGPFPPERISAISEGFSHIFVSENYTEFRCLSKPEKTYRSDDLVIKKIICSGTNNSFLLIATKDGKLKGTMMIHKEIFNH